MKLKDLIRDVHVLEIGADPQMEIAGIAYDSRQVEPGCAFVAISGCSADGNQYIPMAMEKGACVVITMKKPEGNVPYVLVEYDRMALAQMGANFYGHPARDMTVIGITGTNGKTSVTWILEQVIQKTTGQKVGLIGTVENHLAGQVTASVRTTPQSVELQGMFAQMRDAGCQYVVMEVSSHAIDQERIGGIDFQVAAFTNLTHDHLDYHKTMESYCAVKAKLFTRCHKAVVNMDDPWHERMVAASSGQVLTVSAKEMADLYAKDVCLGSDGITFTAVYGNQSAVVEVPIPGRFTVYNVLTVLGVTVQLGISLEEAAQALKTVTGVKGRVEVVSTPGTNYKVLIDFAHTPDGLENVLTSVRDFCKGRLIAVFGSNGDRDVLKRPIMGAIGVKLADIAIITTGDPRSEDPMAIISQVLEGVGGAENYKVIENRAEAIRYAMDIARKDDIIVLAGKGHGTYQEIRGVKHHMDEREIIRSYLAETRV